MGRPCRRPGSWRLVAAVARRLLGEEVSAQLERMVVNSAHPHRYVDDLAALFYGHRQTFKFNMLLVAIGRCAGIYTEMHHCSPLQNDTYPEYVEAMLKPFGVDVRHTDAELNGSFKPRECPPTSWRRSLTTGSFQNGGAIASKSGPPRSIATRSDP